MSRLIHESPPSKLNPMVSERSRFTAEESLACLKACQNLARNHVQKAFDLYMTSFLDALNMEIDRASSNKESTELLGTYRRLRHQSAELKRLFCGAYLECYVKFSKKKLRTAIGSAAPQSPEHMASADTLTMVEDDVLEENIAISSITQRVDTYFAELLWALNQRFAKINNDEPVTESSNPVAPIQFCDALRRMLAAVPLAPNIKLLAYKIFDLHLMGLFRLVAEDVNAHLVRCGALPGLKFSLPKGMVPKSYLSEDHDVALEPSAIGATSAEFHEGELVSAIRDLHERLQYVNPAFGQPLSEDSYDSQAILAALDQLQHHQQLPLVESEGALQAVSIGQLAQQLHLALAQIKGEDSDKRVAGGDLQTIDLVGMLFEYMLDDEHIPDRVKALLSYLHTPFLKVAFNDPGFFERNEHPAKVLLNSLAEASSQWLSVDGADQFDVYGHIKEVVNRILAEYESDLKVVTAQLFQFNEFIKKIKRKQELTEQRAKERAEGEDRLRAVKLQVNDVIHAQTQGKELPSAILLLFLQPWTDYLTFVLLRHGDKHALWLSGEKLIKDVLWCIEPKANLEASQEQKKLEIDILGKLREGFAQIGYQAEKGEKLVQAFRSLCEMARAQKRAAPAPEPMRNELEERAAQRAGRAALDLSNCTKEETQMVESLKMIEFGTWFEFSDGRRLKVAWYNGRTSHYMLVDQIGKRVDTQSGLDLARQLLAGEAKIISGSTKPFFERALENIYQRLNERAKEQGRDAGKAGVDVSQQEREA